MIHPLADVRSLKIGENTTVWQFAVILENAQIGENCNINCHTFIENDVIIGNKVTVKSGVYLWDGICVEDEVFIGPNASFVNDPFPRSKRYPGAFQKTVLGKGCSIGANATILGGLKIGEFALIGAGSVISRDVKPYALMVGNPAKQVGWVNAKGEKLSFENNEWHDSQGNIYKEEHGDLKIMI
jgi:UDP-2-acetamido-3-amino-2,3-dideoxy-glucuronate N-acetyltransferase